MVEAESQWTAADRETQHRVEHRACFFVQIRVPQVSVQRADANLGHPAKNTIVRATTRLSVLRYFAGMRSNLPDPSS